MPTLRRILKYTPAVGIGLLVVAWVASGWFLVGYEFDRQHSVAAFYGSVAYLHDNRTSLPPRGLFVTPAERIVKRHISLAGSLYWSRTAERFGISVPILLIATSTLPLVIGPFVAFRFRLSHYLAYTALVAVELAYYLRW
jgi:hypothetical protein